MDNLDVAVGATGGIVDERTGRVSPLPTVLVVLAVALPVIGALGTYLSFSGEQWDYLSGAAKVGKVLEGVATIACVSGLLVAAASFLRRRPERATEVPADA